LQAHSTGHPLGGFITPVNFIHHHHNLGRWLELHAVQQWRQSSSSLINHNSGSSSSSLLGWLLQDLLSQATTGIRCRQGKHAVGGSRAHRAAAANKWWWCHAQEGLIGGVVAHWFYELIQLVPSSAVFI